MAKKSLIGAGAILLDFKRECMLVVRGQAHGKWGPSKGHRDIYDESQMEDPCDCAVREMMEETGLDISDLIIGDTPTTTYSNYIFYLVEVDSTRYIPIVGDPREICEVKWMSFEEARSLDRENRNVHLSSLVKDLERIRNRLIL